MRHDWPAIVAEIRRTGSFAMDYRDHDHILAVALPPYAENLDPLGALRAEHVDRSKREPTGGWVSSSGIQPVSLHHTEVLDMEVGNVAALLRHYALIKCGSVVIDLGNVGFEWRASWSAAGDRWLLTRRMEDHGRLAASPRMPEDLLIDAPVGASDDQLLAVFTPRQRLHELATIAKRSALRGSHVGDLNQVRDALAVVEAELLARAGEPQ